MAVMNELFRGGLLRGKRTYILAGVGVVTAVANYVVGDISLGSMIVQVILSLGLGTLRAGIENAQQDR